MICTSPIPSVIAPPHSAQPANGRTSRRVTAVTAFMGAARYGAAHSRGGSIATTFPVFSPFAEMLSGVAQRSSLVPAKRTVNSPASDASDVASSLCVPIAIDTDTGSFDRNGRVSVDAHNRRLGGVCEEPKRGREDCCNQLHCNDGHKSEVTLPMRHVRS